MTKKQDDILLRLQATIQSWTGEVTDAHNDLTRQIEQTKEQLGLLVRVIAPKGEDSQATSSVEIIEREQAIARRDAEIEELRQTKNRLDNEIAGLRSTVDDVLQHNAQLTEAQHSLTSELAALQTRQASELDGEGLTEIQAQVEALEEQRESDVESVKAELAAKTEEADGLTQRLDEMAEELAQAKAVAEESPTSPDTDTQVQAELESERLAAEEAARGKEAIEAERDAAQQEVEALHSKLADTVAKTEGLLKSLEDVSEQLEEAEAAQAQAQSHADTKTQGLEATQAELDSARRSVEANAAVLEEATRDVEQLRADIAKKDARIEQLVEESAPLEAKTSEKDFTLLKSKQDIQALQVELEELSAKLEQLPALEIENADLTKRLEHAQAQANQAQELGAQGKAQAELDEIQVDLETFERYLVDRESVLNSAATNLDKFLVFAASIEERINDLEALPTSEDHEDVESGLVNEIAELNDRIGVLRQANTKYLHLQRDILEEEQNRILLSTFDDEGRIRHMGQILVEAGVIDKDQLKEALRRQANSEGEPLGKILVQAGMTDEETVKQVLVNQLKLPFTRMDELNAARSEQAASSAAMHATLADAEELRTCLAQREKTVDEQARRIVELEQSLDTFQQDLADLREKSSETPENELRLGKLLEEAQKHIKTLDDNLEEKTETAEERGTQIRNQEDSLRNFEQRIEELLNNASAEEDDSIDLSQHLEDVTQRNESLRAALIQRDVEIETLKKLHAEAAQAITEQGERIAGAAYDAEGRKRAMGEILVNAGIINEKQLENALDEQRSSQQRRLGTILVEKGLIHEEIIAQVLASQLGLTFIRLGDKEIEPDAIGLMNGRLATHHMCIPIQRDDGEVTIAMANPLDLIAIEDLEFATRLTVKPVVATLADITSAIVRCYGIDSGAPSDVPSETLTEQ